MSDPTVDVHDSLSHHGYALPLAPAHFRTLRELVGVEQRDLAERFGYGDRTVRRWDVTHKAPLIVQEWVIDCWVQVRNASVAIIDTAPDEITRSPTGWEHGPDWTPGMDAAVARLVVAQTDARVSTYA